MDASRDRKEPELLSELIHLTQDPEVRIRTKLAEVLRLNSNQPAVQALGDLLQDGDAHVREAALKSTAGRPEFRTAQETCLRNDAFWGVRFAAANALENQNNPQVLKTLFAGVQDRDNDIGEHCAEIIERRLNRSPDATQHLPAEISNLLKVEKLLKGFGTQRFPRLVSWLTAQTTVSVDAEALAR